jgi:hypothetical protein
LSSLLEEIINNCGKEQINLIDIRVLLRILKDVPFNNELKALHLSNELIKYLNSKNYSKFKCKIKKLEKLILGDYIIDGSLIILNKKEIFWDTEIKFIHKRNHH